MLSQNIYDGIFWIAVASCAVAQLFILRAVFRVTPGATPHGSTIAGSTTGGSTTGGSTTGGSITGGSTAGGSAATGFAATVSATNGLTSSSPEGELVSVPTPHRLTEIVWVVLPVALLVLAFVGAWRVMHPVLPDWLPPGAEIIGR